MPDRGFHGRHDLRLGRRSRNEENDNGSQKGTTTEMAVARGWLESHREPGRPSATF
jgi:hypothetical protein